MPEPVRDPRAGIEQFLSAASFVVIGASDDPRKYGHKVYASYLRHGRKAFPVNPNAATVLGNTAYADLLSLPEPVEAVSIITPPDVTQKVMEDVLAAGIRHVWLQPGAESPAAVGRAERAGLNVIWGGPCVLVALG
jgi:uncharacterized protein